MFEETKQVRQRSEQLLFKYLTREQIKSWRKHGAFIVTLCNGNIYVIGRQGWQIYRAKVFESSKINIMGSYCLMSLENRYGHPLPDADHALAMKLLIEANEYLFLFIANFTGISISSSHYAHQLIERSIKGSIYTRFYRYFCSSLRSVIAEIAS